MLDSIINAIPEIGMLRERSPLFWPNRSLIPSAEVLPFLDLGMSDMEDARSRLHRFAPLLAGLFPELAACNGIIESPLVPVPQMADALAGKGTAPFRERLLIKADHALPVSGSIKARGGIYEVLFRAEELALRYGIISDGSDYEMLSGPQARSLFSQHTIMVGSTGNLGLSIGIAGAALGFNTVVHMSAEARQWKKLLLRERGVTVVEHDTDYTAAVKAGREAALKDPSAYFIDDEQSHLLFLGYSVAAFRLAEQLSRVNRTVDVNHPLYVYLPCGVGGAPGGITFGLKHVFGDAVRCFIVEPVESPCMLLGMLTGFNGDISVYDIGLGGMTVADGLAVGKPSRFAGRIIEHLANGFCTVSDRELLRYLRLLYASEGIKIEPSAAAGFRGLEYIVSDTALRDTNTLHIVWTTGGSMVPDEEFSKWIR